MSCCESALIHRRSYDRERARSQLRELYLKTQATAGRVTSEHDEKAVTIDVSVTNKSPDSPWYGKGSKLQYSLHWPAGIKHCLKRGQTYRFHVDGTGHTFYLSDKAQGGPGYPSPLTGKKDVQIGDVMFTPNESTPRLIYAVCGLHKYMTVPLDVCNPV